jgi:hypothetical protein
MLSTNGGSTSALIGFMMAMTNTYGLLIIIVLMGNGLVALPRRIWEMGNTSAELARLYMMVRKHAASLFCFGFVLIPCICCVQATSVDTNFHDARFELEDCEIEAKHLNQKINSSETYAEFVPYIKIIKERIESFDFKGKSMSRQYSQQIEKPASDDKDIRKALVSLNARLLTAQRQIMASSRRWISLLETVRYLEVGLETLSTLYHSLTFSQLNLPQNVTNGTLRPEDSSWCEMRVSTQKDLDDYESSSAITKTIVTAHNKVRYLWRMKCYSIFCKVSAVLCAIASIFILVGELSMGIDAVHSPVGWILVAVSSGGAGIFITQVIAFLTLAYMSICTYWALFRMNLGWAFTLQPDQQSPATSLLFNATYLCRLQFSLAFNFLLIIDRIKR